MTDKKPGDISTPQSPTQSNEQVASVSASLFQDKGDYKIENSDEEEGSEERVIKMDNGGDNQHNESFFDVEMEEVEPFEEELSKKLGNHEDEDNANDDQSRNSRSLSEDNHSAYSQMPSRPTTLFP